MANILVVDDELGIRDLLFEILNDEGHNVELAENAAEARAARQRARPDLVLLDIWMPDTDGVTLLKEWSTANLLTMPVNMMSGHPTLDPAVAATRIGAFAFMEKTITLQKLLKAVEQCLPRECARRAAAPVVVGHDRVPAPAHTELQAVVAAHDVGQEVGAVRFRFPGVPLRLVGRAERAAAQPRRPVAERLHVPTAPLDGFDAMLEIWNGDRLVRSEPARRAAGPALALRAGERAALQVRNTSGHSVDLVVAGLDAQGGLRAVYPDDPGDSNRFERGTREAPAAKRFELPWFAGAGARLYVFAMPATPQSAPRLFGSGVAESPMAELRLRGQPNPQTRPLFAAMVSWSAGDAPAR